MRKKLFSVVIIILIVMCCCVPANAYVLFGHKLIGGVGNSGYNTRYYWLDTHATNNYVTVINQAMYSWNHTATTPGVTTSIWFEPVASSSYSIMDIYSYSTSNSIANGSTTIFGTYYDHTSYVAPAESDWRWCQIKLYGGNFDENLLASNNITLRSTVAHEMGHVFGLNENNSDASSIMCQAYRRNVNVLGPSADDCIGINQIY